MAGPPVAAARPDGTFCLSRGRDEAVWPTSLALFTRAALEQDAESLHGPVGALLRIRGRVIPVTWDHVHLCAELADGSRIESEAGFSDPRRDPRIGICRVHLAPRARANPEAALAIASSDFVVARGSSTSNRLIDASDSTSLSRSFEAALPSDASTSSLVPTSTCSRAIESPLSALIASSVST